MNESIGILGGGQLGKMLCLAGAPLNLNIHVMDSSLDHPAATVCPHYVRGDFTDFRDVIDFGRDKDILTIEIEKINVDALSELEEAGKQVYPQPHIIRTIQDKGKQKNFYVKHGLPTAPHKLFEGKCELVEQIEQGEVNFPFIQKICVGGYDGRGVRSIKSWEDMENAFTDPFIIEERINIHKEISVIVCGDQQGNYVVYDPVEMVFDPQNHILLYQLGPASIPAKQQEDAKKLALRVAKEFQIVGLLAIEMFVDKDGQILINEAAPRPHNSGHHTIEATYCSQYENHLRAVSGLPLGSPQTTFASLLMNLLGHEDYQGKPIYDGIQTVLREDGVHIHIYGKKETKPFRKMGHINIIGHKKDNLVRAYKRIQQNIKVIA